MIKAIINELPQLLIDEGYYDSIYKDSLGYPTFGVGTLITEDMLESKMPIGAKIPERRSLEMFFHEMVNKVAPDIEAIFGEDFQRLPRDVQQIFVNMLYNLGRTRFLGFKKMLAAVIVADWPEAAKEMLDSRWAKQVKGRANRLSQRMANAN